MDSRKKQSEQSLPLAESGAAIVRSSASLKSSATKNARFAARTAPTRGMSVNTPVILKIRESAARLITGPISKVSEPPGKTGSLLPTVSPVNGMTQNSQSKAEDALFAGQQNQIIAVISCLSTIGIAAAKSALAAVNAFAAFFAVAVIHLLNALIPLQIGQKRLSPILGGTHD